MASDRWQITLHPSISDIPAEDWDRCAGAAHPLQCHALLLALEESGSASIETGWIPRHISLTRGGGGDSGGGGDGSGDGNGDSGGGGDGSGDGNDQISDRISDPTNAPISDRIVGVVPFYVKTHSYGEYVFDHAWADAWGRAGGQYYPKGQAAIPFTPVPGQRLLLDPAAPPQARLALAEGMIEAGAAMGLSSLHITFLDAAEADLLTDSGRGWISRRGMQFHWHNRGYRDFDDFLAALVARKRKTIRRERRHVAEAGVKFTRLTGADLTSSVWDAFYRFYLATLEKKWGGAYLTRGFFEAIQASMADRIVLIMAEQDGTAIAGALNFIGREALYGRNWGSLVDLPFLHFETCYYQAIDAATEYGLARLEAGAQGLHKVQRGYAPVDTWSAHYFWHDGFAEAIRRYTSAEAARVGHEAEELRTWMPYRKE